MKVDSKDINDLAVRIQEVIDTREGILKTIGEAIRLDKSFVYTLSFNFNTDREVKHKKVDNMDIYLNIYNKKNVREPLQLINTDRGIETLGVYIALDGNIEDKKEKLKKKVRI